MEETYFGTISNVDWEMIDSETDLEPVARTRSNTWPVPQPENYWDANILTDSTSAIGSIEYIKTDRSAQEGTSGKAIEGSSRKKKTPRQNPWGNLSYAELISQAISSADGRRLTLSQIYDWMVQNVPFFKDKGESKSSAGWKNSIRHNLSLHNRFMRIPNEKLGKSSWWTINPNAQSSKTTRRRSASMEAGKLEKKRALVKKQADSLRKKLLRNESVTASNDSIDSVVQSAVVNKHLYGRFRPRASSCASSIGSLSLIPRIPEEPIWTSSEYQEPATQPPVQPMNQPPMQPIVQVYNNQEYQHPTGDQIFVAPQTFTEVTNICLMHPVGGCNCSNPAVITNEIPNSSSGNQGNAMVLSDSFILNMIQSSTCAGTVEVTESASLQRNEQSEVNYNHCALVEQANQATGSRVLPRNNSLLDDIDQIIKKDGIIEIENVNHSITTTLFISNNNNNNNTNNNNNLIYYQ